MGVLLLIAVFAAGIANHIQTRTAAPAHSVYIGFTGPLTNWETLQLTTNYWLLVAQSSPDLVNWQTFYPAIESWNGQPAFEMPASDPFFFCRAWLQPRRAQ